MSTPNPMLFTIADYYNLARRDVYDALRILFEELERPGTRESREAAMRVVIDVLRELDGHLDKHGAAALLTSLNDTIARSEALAKEALKPGPEDGSI